MTTNNTSWRTVDARNWRGYANWQLGESFGYVDASSNYQGLVGFVNNQVEGEKKITKVNNVSYLQRTKKLALTATGGTDFSYNTGLYTLNQNSTNTTFLKATDFYHGDLADGFTVHAKFSVDADNSNNVRLLNFRVPQSGISSLNIYKDGSLNSLKITYVYNPRVFINTKLMDYSANTIYNAFINVAKYGSSATYKAFVYDNSNNLVGNRVNWIDTSNACPFTEITVGDLSLNNAVFKGKLYNLNLISPNTSYYTFGAAGGTDYATTADYFTTNATGANTTYLSILDTNAGVVSQNAPLSDAINGKSVKMDFKFKLNSEARTVVKQAVPTAVDFPTAIDSSFSQIVVSGNTNQNAYLNGIYDASSSTTITKTPVSFSYYTPSLHFDASVNTTLLNSTNLMSVRDPSTNIIASSFMLDSMIPSIRSTAVAAYSVRRLSISYTGPVMKVRRVSDSSAIDFYANSNRRGTAITSLPNFGGTNID
ncbi:MAG: hypothetical protein FJ308_23295, partial [Planctomycetes bacterium]|nr:hypothetical protein [Planctomycetota bacterium]